MSAILEEGIGFGGRDIIQEGINYDKLPLTTDVIISQYEHKLNASIASKTLESTKKGVPPVFTKEEWAYLNKKAVDDSTQAEVKVITPAPTITLKKGNTEINIKNAAALVQKMQEMYPNGMAEDTAANINRQPFVNASIKHGVEQEETFVAPTPIVPPQPEQKTVNKNAYEIRTDVLSMALDWVKFKKDSNQSVSSVSDDDVLSTAQKFYKFVENRR